MKLMKKLIAALLPALMALSMAVTAMAEGAAATITAPNNGHTYEAYQIFTGDISGDQLTNIKWGANGTGTVGMYVSADVTNEIAAVNDEAKSNTEKLAVITKYVDLTGTAKYELNAGPNTVEPGYYLIKDKTISEDAENQSSTLYIVKVAGAAEFNPKGSSPTVEKKVYEEEKGWQDGADYDIGDDVPFKLTATLGDTADYTTYFVQFDDTLCEGLSYNNDATVTIVNGEDTKGVTDSFTITYNESEHYLEVKCNDIKAIEGATITTGTQIVVEYTAELTTDAKIGTPGNFNEVKLEYSNNPNVDHDGDKGETPTDKVVVFTYEIIANKVDGNGDELEGAGFTLYKKVGNEYVAVGDEITGVTTFEFKGVDAGEYKLVETTVPAGYNKADDIEFTIVATYDTLSADPELKTLSVTPADAGFTCTVANGTVETTIENFTGAVLPETGGMGTTLFYVFGGLLAVGAAVLLITNRRMEA